MITKYKSIDKSREITEESYNDFDKWLKFNVWKYYQDKDWQAYDYKWKLFLDNKTYIIFDDDSEYIWVTDFNIQKEFYKDTYCKE